MDIFQLGVIPVFALIYGYEWLGVPISWALIPSVGVVLIGLYLFYQDELHAGKGKQ